MYSTSCASTSRVVADSQSAGRVPLMLLHKERSLPCTTARGCSEKTGAVEHCPEEQRESILYLEVTHVQYSTVAKREEVESFGGVLLAVNQGRERHLMESFRRTECSSTVLYCTTVVQQYYRCTVLYCSSMVMVSRPAVQID